MSLGGKIIGTGAVVAVVGMGILTWEFFDSMRTPSHIVIEPPKTEQNLQISDEYWWSLNQLELWIYDSNNPVVREVKEGTNNIDDLESSLTEIKPPYRMPYRIIVGSGLFMTGTGLGLLGVVFLPVNRRPYRNSDYQK